MKFYTSRADLGKQIHTTVASLGEKVSIDWAPVGELPVVRLTLPTLIVVWVTVYPLGKTSVVAYYLCLALCVHLTWHL